MSVTVGAILLLIGLTTFIYLFVSAYKEFQHENKTSIKLLFFIVVLFEIGKPSTLSGLALWLSLIAAVIGIVFITELSF